MPESVARLREKWLKIEDELRALRKRMRVLDKRANKAFLKYDKAEQTERRGTE